jgi:asparagine synthase (glutamine-hydrolysing)
MQDKYILRRAAERHLPKSIAWRPKAMFRAPWDIADAAGAHPNILLSDEVLTATGYFDSAAVRRLMAEVQSLKPGGAKRTIADQLLAGVVMTQLWHHIFIEDLGVPVDRFETATPDSGVTAQRA